MPFLKHIAKWETVLSAQRSCEGLEKLNKAKGLSDELLTILMRYLT